MAGVLEVWAFDRRTEPARGYPGPRARRGGPRCAARTGLAVRRRARPDALPARAGPNAARRVLQRAGRRALPRQLDPLVFSRDIDAVVTAALNDGEQQERLPRRALGRHRLHRPLRGDRLQPHRQSGPPSRATRSCAAWCCSRAAAARPSARRSPPTRSTASRRSSTAGSSAPCATTRRAASTARRRARSPPRPPTAPGRRRRSARRRRTAYAVASASQCAASWPPSEPPAIQGITDPEHRVGHHPTGSPRAIPWPATTRSPKCPTSPRSASFRRATVDGGLRQLLDDDGVIAVHGRLVRGRRRRRRRARWSAGCTPGRTFSDGPLPTPTCRTTARRRRRCPAPSGAQENDVTRLDRMMATFFAGGTNFSDWYYPSAGLEHDQRRRRVHVRRLRGRQRRRDVYDSDADCTSPSVSTRRSCRCRTAAAGATSRT